MPKCPKCGKEIDYVLEYHDVLTQTAIYADRSVELDRLDSGLDYLTYDCPECGAELFQSWDEAKAFIRAGKING
jgi:predicted RNA-binding Zn-ribbon protein involved in translation (DUF1610 family)